MAGVGTHWLRRGITLKLERLLDTHLDGLIDKSEYQAKKNALVIEKAETTEQLKKLEQGATGWLEPCHVFLKAANQACALEATGDLESKKEFVKKIGSNFHLAAQTLRFETENPWNLLAQSKKNRNFKNWRRGGGADSSHFKLNQNQGFQAYQRVGFHIRSFQFSDFKSFGQSLLPKRNRIKRD